jgi:hypothetical protein
MNRNERRKLEREQSKCNVHVTSSYEGMYPSILKSIKNGVKPVVVTNGWEQSDISISKAREILKNYASDEWPMLEFAAEFNDGSIKELIDLYEQNKFWYGFSKYQSRCSDEELIKEWMISNFRNQQQLITDMNESLQHGHLFAIIESYLLMGDKFAKIALKNFKLQ